MNFNILGKETVPFVNKSRRELENIPFEIFKNIGLKIEPKEFDFVYGYPSLKELQSIDKINPTFLKTNEKVGLYIHIPFCTKICSFCYFIKEAKPNREYVKEYVKALKKEIEYYSKLAQKAEISFCYIGGGTPTYLCEEDLLGIFQTIKVNYTFTEDFEFTCEGSPETLTENKLKLLKENGVTRVSVGVQSFNDELTLKMNRAHNQRDSIALIELLTKYFPHNFNIDIIYGYPNSTEEILFKDIEICNSLNVPSITLYQIWMKVNTALRKLKREVKREDIFLQKLVAKNYLTSSGYYRDKSDWYIRKEEAKFKFQNHKWQNKFFYGIGVSAYAYVNDLYYRNETNIDNYLKRIYNNEIGVGTSIMLSSEDTVRRACSLGIKMDTGIDLNFIKERDEKVTESFKIIFEKLVETGLGKFEDNHFRLSELGFLIPDNISALFFSDKSAKSFSKQKLY